MATSPSRLIIHGGGSSVFVPAAATAPTTLDPTTIIGGATLSNGNLTVTVSSGGGSVQTVFSTTSHSSGKYYYEVTINANSEQNGGYTVACGISNVNSGISDTVGMGNNTQDAGMWGNPSDGNFYQNNNTATSTGLTYGNTNDVLSVALDIGNNTIWYRVNGGNWNGNASNNPATNTGGISVSPTNTGSVLWAALAVANFGSNQLTINFGGSSYSFTPPSGFGNW